MTYEGIRQEYEGVRIGPLLWQLLLDVAGRVARKYPPAVYNDGEPWSEEAVRDLALEVALNRLLDENQLDYVMTIAEEHPPSHRHDALAGLLAFQIRRVLSHRRHMTVVDRLYGRVRTLAESSKFLVTAAGADTAVSSAANTATTGTASVQPLSDSDIKRGVRLIADIPRISSRLDSERESKVYAAANLEELVTRVVDAFGSVLLGDIRKILENILTAWVPTVLPSDEEVSVSPSTPELELERMNMHESVGALASSLGSVHRQVLTSKSQGISDTVLAQRLGRSRPWIADRKAEVLQRVQAEVMEGLSEQLHDEAVRRLLEVLSELDEGDA